MKRFTKRFTKPLHPLQEALLLADVSRLMGNKDWRLVFVKLISDEDLPPSEQSEFNSLMYALYESANEAVLELNFKNLCDSR